MLKKKSIKTLIAWLLIAVMLIPYSVPAIATENVGANNAETKTLTSTFILNPGDPDEYGYKMNRHGILYIIENGSEYDDTFYCLDCNKSFPEGETILYTKVSDMSERLGDKYIAVERFTKSMLENDVTSEEIKDFVSIVFDEFISWNYEEGTNFSSGGKVYDGTSNENEYKEAYITEILKYLSITDINKAQQLALWYIMDGENNLYYEGQTVKTNNDMGSFKNGYNPVTGKYVYQFPAIQLEDMFGVSKDMDPITKIYFGIIANYMIINSETITQTQIIYPTIDRSVSPKGSFVSDGNTDYCVAGPFKVNSGRGIASDKYHISLSVDNYTLFADRECTTLLNEQNVQNVLDTEYYVRVAANNDLTKLTLNLSFEDRIEKTPTMWVPEDDRYQRVISIEEETIKRNPESISVNFEKGDLALRKAIYSINGDDSFSRQPKPYIDDLKAGAETATYKHAKNPIEVEVGNRVVYQITVYNEGSIAATPLEITDYLPEGLKFVKNSSLNEKFGWDISNDGRTAKTQILSNTNLAPFNSETGALSSVAIQIECEIAEGLEAEKVLTNVAEITADNIKDRDSDTGSINPSTITDSYSGNKNNPTDLSDEGGYYAGIQDDDDFEKVIIKGNTFDLNLKKFISTINGKKSNRNITVDTKPLIDGTSKNAKYNLDKSPITVEAGDIVKYTLRVYNESTISGYAEEIADYLPEGLGFLVNYNGNIDNFWSVTEAIANGAKTVKLSDIENGTKNLKLDDFTNETSLEDATVLIGKNAKLISTKLASNKDSNLIEKFDGSSSSLNYKEVEVTCIVLANGLSADQLKNVAEINKALDEDKQLVEDRDSTPGTVNPENYPGNDKNQDDHDYEVLTQEQKEFDLSLQKFIVGVNDEKISDRAPIVTKGSDGKFQYVHPKDPVKVANTDLVTYEIRVYNEGEVDGYAAEVQDDIPDGLVFLPDNETNKKYGWKLYDKYGKETSDINQATAVKTSYLSKEDSSQRNEDALIKAYDGKAATPDYKSIQIVFKIDEKGVEATTTTEKRIITNVAEIARDTDAEGKDVTDKDSTPSNGKDGEDDIDREKVYVKYFDLALEKYLSKIIITEDGQTREIVANDRDSLLKVEVHRKKIDTTVVKFVYNIEVTNEGEIEGFATEIKDHIPEGLKFVAEDNPDWTANSEKEIVTNALAKTPLEPGKSATVSVTLTWINGESNMGTKINVAEISEDYNEKGDTPDIDSIPNNNVEGEDDIDEAPVMLTVSTGSDQSYITLAFVVAITLATGIILVKKYVL